MHLPRVFVFNTVNPTICRAIGGDGPPDARKILHCVR